MKDQNKYHLDLNNCILEDRHLMAAGPATASPFMPWSNGGWSIPGQSSYFNALPGVNMNSFTQTFSASGIFLPGSNPLLSTNPTAVGVYRPVGLNVQVGSGANDGSGNRGGGAPSGGTAGYGSVVSSGQGFSLSSAANFGSYVSAAPGVGQATPSSTQGNPVVQMARRNTPYNPLGAAQQNMANRGPASTVKPLVVSPAALGPATPGPASTGTPSSNEPAPITPPF